MANTTNYNWETPDDTDLVKDGAAAIRTLGSSVDTTTKALNPSTTLGDIEYRSATANTNTRLAIGTTGQVLTVSGGVPTWATSDDANAIQNAIVDAKGDLIAASAADTPARLAVGANGTVLTADSSETTGLKWATPAGSAFVGVRAVKNATQSIANATETVITWTGTDTFDTNSFHDTSTNTGRLTVPVGKAGYYLIFWCVQYDVNATGRRTIALYVNSTTDFGMNEFTANAVAYPTGVGSTIYYLNENDFVHLTSYQDSGGSLNLTASVKQYFGMQKVG